MNTTSTILNKYCVKALCIIYSIIEMAFFYLTGQCISLLNVISYDFAEIYLAISCLFISSISPFLSLYLHYSHYFWIYLSFTYGITLCYTSLDETFFSISSIIIISVIRCIVNNYLFNFLINLAVLYFSIYNYNERIDSIFYKYKSFSIKLYFSTTFIYSILFLKFRNLKYEILMAAPWLSIVTQILLMRISSHYNYCESNNNQIALILASVVVNMVSFELLRCYYCIIYKYLTNDNY